MNLRSRTVAALAVFVSACVGTPRPEPGPPPPSPYPSSTPLHAESPAIASLMDGARTDYAAGRLANAAASLERALRIEPRNPRLWQELSRVRLLQRDYVQAESCAQRSNSWAGGDTLLVADNWRLIAQAREARGDSDGVRAARDAAERLK
ncbi:MAG TPA: tetratricopeptide repeat protein [Burkholderiales bacterium]|jgi:predicted Zn-dependent protease|nr:tetratricopeptide repeat protein [Burkholderiales bacterium]